MNHWIIVPVILPALVAPIILLLVRGNLTLQRLLGLTGTLVLCGVAVGLMQSAMANPPQAYRLGDWPAPFGIVLVLDRLAALMLMLTGVLALIVQAYAVATRWDARGKHFHVLFLFQMMGLNGAFLTGDAFNLFVFFEVLLIASYGLMIHAGGQARLRAGVQYVAFNLVGSTLFLFALATIYSVTGTLNMADLAVKVAALPPGDFALIRVGGVLLLLVFAIKGALVPLHFWLPGTYANAPGPAAAQFAIMTKVGAYAVIRVGTLVFPPGTPATGAMYTSVLLPAGLITLIAGAIGVLGAKTLPRLVAFVAIASMGTVFVAVSQFTAVATAAALYYIVHSTLATAALFLIADLVLARRASGSLRHTLPPMAQGEMIAGLFFVTAIAVAGMPPLSGFLGKLMILQATREYAGLIWAVILTTSLILILGLARAGSLMFWKAHQAGERLEAHRPDRMAFACILALLALLLGLTVAAQSALDYLTATATQLFEPAGYIAANALPAGGNP
jgi:multicomponent K+:H+ antiporter subunit D